MKKMIIMLGCTIGLASGVKAQVMVAPAAGFTLNNAFVKMNSEDKQESKIKMGFRAGGLVALPLTNSISLMPGVFYSMKGYKQITAGIESETSLNYVEVPVNVAYMSGTPGSGRFMAHIGPYVAYGFSGKTKVEGPGVDKTTDVEFGNEKGKHMIKPIEIGANAGVGYMLPMGLFGRLEYHHGLSNSMVGGDNKNSYKNYGFGLTVGYFFGG